jgi:cytosine/adenosine deaminase-related metal-dependent hydrolase
MLPLEPLYADLDFAERNYRALVGHLLANGTTNGRLFRDGAQAVTRRLIDI